MFCRCGRSHCLRHLAAQLLSKTNIEALEEIFVTDGGLCKDGRLSGISGYTVAASGFADIHDGYFGTEKMAINVIRPFSSSGGSLPENKLLKVRFPIRGIESTF